MYHLHDKDQYYGSRNHTETDWNPWSSVDCCQTFTHTIGEEAMHYVGNKFTPHIDLEHRYACAMYQGIKFEHVIKKCII